MITQLAPPLHMDTPKGSGWAHFVIDYGPESALMWVVFMDEDGACWTVPNPEIRLTFNWTLGRRKPEESFAAPGQPAQGKPRAPRRFRPSLAYPASGEELSEAAPGIEDSGA